MMGDEYVVMTMCHCHHPKDCEDHWEVGIPKSGYNPRTGHVSIARDVSGPFRMKADAQLFADAKNAQRGARDD